MKTVILTSLAFAIVCVIAGVIIVIRPVTRDTALPEATAAQGVAPVRIADASRLAAPPEGTPPAAAPAAAAAPTSPLPVNTPSPEISKAAGQATSRAATTGQGGSPGKESLQDPLAREALAFAGADPTATEYWYSAINDPDLPAKERQDLIEDLNEDGLSDPKHPVPEDLPLILSRIALIERIAPTAPDQVNADALQEAYKDLLQLARMAMGSGERVR